MIIKQSTDIKLIHWDFNEKVDYTKINNSYYECIDSIEIATAKTSEPALIIKWYIKIFDEYKKIQFLNCFWEQRFLINVDYGIQETEQLNTLLHNSFMLSKNDFDRLKVDTPFNKLTIRDYDYSQRAVELQKSLYKKFPPAK